MNRKLDRKAKALPPITLGNMPDKHFRYGLFLYDPADGVCDCIAHSTTKDLVQSNFRLMSAAYPRYQWFVLDLWEPTTFISVVPTMTPDVVSRIQWTPDASRRRSSRKVKVAA